MYKLRRDETELLQYQLDAELKVLDALDRHYRDAMGTIDDTIAKLMGRGDANLPHVIHQVKYQRALRAQVEATLDLLQSQEYEDISQYMFQSYEDGFIGAMYSMHHQDVPLIIPIDPVQMVEAVQLDSQISEGLNKRLGVDTKKLKKTITSEISRGIASGLMYSDIARNIRNASGIPLRRAKTIARTEAGRIQEKARADAANDAKELGADVVKQWCAVLDGKTRESHRAVDGQIRELEDKFSNGLMYPKAAGGAAKEVINCRCTHLIRAKWALDEDELKILRERAASHGLHVKDSKAYGQAKAKDFAAFKKNYLKAAETEAEFQRRKTAEDGHQIIDKATYNKLTKTFVKKGGIIIRGEEAERHLKATGAYASYLPSLNAAYIRDDARISDVLEEMYHAEQDRVHMFGEIIDEEVYLRREIDAQKYLISMTERYKIPSEEVNVTKKNLELYEKRLEELLARRDHNE